MASGSTHTLLEPTIIAKEALMLLENNLVMGANVHRQYKNEFQKIGGTLTIRKPNKFTVTKARTRATSTLTEQSITLTVSTQAHVSWSFNTKDLTLTIEEYSERWIKPAVSVLANQVDLDLTALYDDVWNEVYESTGFVTPESFIVLGKAGQRLDEEAAPQEDRVVVLNPAAHWSLANAFRNSVVTPIAGSATRKGYMATIAGMEVFMDQNIKTHTTGHFHDTGSSESINFNTSGGATGTVLGVVDCRVQTTAVFRVGDVFTIADVYAVNPVSGQSTGTLRQFVVTATASNVSSVTDTATDGECVVYIQPDMIDTGPFKTIDTLPAAAASITVVGTQSEPYPINLAFHKNAFALVTVPLEMPHNVWGARETHNGLSIRVVKDYSIDDDDEICRLDILYGVKTLYPELACRIRGAEG